MPRQKLTAQHKRIVKLARKCGMDGWVDSELAEVYALGALSKLSGESLDYIEGCLKDQETLLESLRNPN